MASTKRKNMEPMAFLLGQVRMARGQPGSRSSRHYPTDPPRRRRVPVEEVEYVDGLPVAIEVSADMVLPRAKTVRQMRKRSQVLKGGSYGPGTVIHYSLSEAEKLLLNSMGSTEPVAQD